MENKEQEANMEHVEMEGDQPKAQTDADGRDDDRDLWNMAEEMMSHPARGHRGKRFMGRGEGRGRGHGPPGPHMDGLDSGGGFGMEPHWYGYPQHWGPMMAPWNYPQAFGGQYAAYNAPYSAGSWQPWMAGPPQFQPATWGSGRPGGRGGAGIPPRLLRRIRRLAEQMEDNNENADSDTESNDEDEAGKREETKQKRGAEKRERRDARRRARMACAMEDINARPGPMGWGGLPHGPPGPMGWRGRPGGPLGLGRRGPPPHVLQKLRRLVAVMERKGPQTTKDKPEQAQALPNRRQLLLINLKNCLSRMSDHETRGGQSGRGLRRGSPGKGGSSSMPPQRLLYQMLAAVNGYETNNSDPEVTTTGQQNDTDADTGAGNMDTKPGTEKQRVRNAEESHKEKHSAADLLGDMDGWEKPMNMAAGPMGMGPMGMGPMGMGPMGMHGPMGMPSGPMGVGPGTMGMGYSPMGMGYGPPMQAQSNLPPRLLHRLNRIVTAMEEQNQKRSKGNGRADGAEGETDQHQENQSNPHTHARAEEQDATPQTEDSMQTDTASKDDWTELCQDVETLDLAHDAPTTTESQLHHCPTCTCTRTDGKS